jgi:hypothetical protein
MRYLDGINTARRYARSIHLERDLSDVHALEGYVITARGRETLALFRERYEKEAAVRAFTVTAVYGAGKSAFMHFLLSLLAPQKSPMRSTALQALRAQKVDADVVRFFEGLSALTTPFLRAVAVSRSESIGMTLARAIHGATVKESGQAEKYAHGLALEFMRQTQSGKGGKSARLIEAITCLAQKRPVMLAIDELGKNLEQVAVGENDVYLLQMLAELPQQNFPVYFFGLLHSAFSDYGGRLGARERAEWQKIQGRFEDIPFLDSTENTMSLIAAAIEQKPVVARAAQRIGEAWQKTLRSESDIWSKVFPLHPLAARALPMLCARFGQNERSLFNYLTGHEPHAFHAFLAHTQFDEKQPRLLRLSDLYDYFIESANLASIERQSRLLELRDRIRANEHLDSTHTDLLKTIAVLNALSAGNLKASHEMVMLAMTDTAKADEKQTGKALAELLAKRVITYRKQADEYRLWAGSENDVEALIKMELNRVPKNLAEALNTKFALRTVVASRHSFEFGTLRFFPALFVDAGHIGKTIPKGDGYVLYDISEPKAGRRDSESQKSLFEPAEAVRLPVIRVMSAKTNALRTLAREVLALESLMHGRQALALDAVARREVTERYYLMAERLREMIQREYTMLGKGTRIECTPPLDTALAARDRRRSPDRPLPKVPGTLNQIASVLCDRVYNSGFKLKNELINRQSISTQIARARGEIVARLLKYRENAKEHFSGNGPEVSVFRAVTEKKYSAGLKPARKAIEDFANKAKEARPLAELFRILSEPPYGIRSGVMPLLLVQYLLENEDSVSLYQDGSFIPEITPELLEILVRRPERFALKKFVLSGLEAEYFAELTKAYAFSPRASTGSQKERPATVAARPQSSGRGESIEPRRTNSLLAVIKPLIKFGRSLPRFTQSTRQLSENALRLRAALLNAREPDALIFREIPMALGFDLSSKNRDSGAVRWLTRALAQALHELQNAYPKLLEVSRRLLVDALRVPQNTDLRQYLSAMAGLLAGQVLDPALRRFMNAAQDRDKNDQQWLEGVVMVVADKPAENWRDEDKHTFEANLATLAQKFLNLQQLAAKMQAAGNGKFDARLVTITTSDGSELREVIWVDAAEQKLAEEFKAQLKALPLWQETPGRIRQAVLADLLQQLIAPPQAEVNATGAAKTPHIVIERRGKASG